MTRRSRALPLTCLLVLTAVLSGCAKKQLSATTPSAPAGTTIAPATPADAPAPPARPAQRVDDVLAVPQDKLTDDMVAGKSLDDLNRDSPFRPVFFGLDSSDLDAEGQRVVEQAAAVLKSHPTWAVTIEGHCDERGTAEYNLALGERRASAARAHLVTLGISAERLRVVSYGKEFPFDPAHTDSAWAKNRRAHFVITAK